MKEKEILNKSLKNMVEETQLKRAEIESNHNIIKNRVIIKKDINSKSKVIFYLTS